MANLGSEVQRMFSLKEQSLTEEAEASYGRVCDIVNTLLKHPGLAGRNEEIALLKNHLEQSFRDERVGIYKRQMQTYFLPYAKRMLSVISA